MSYQFQYIENPENVDIQYEYLLSQKPRVEQAVMRAVSSTYGITDSFPKSAKGTTFYNEIIANLREQFITEGFERLWVNNIELTISKELGFAFYFCRSDEQTGFELGMPRSLRKKGTVTQQVLGLVTHYSLFPELNTVPGTDLNIWAIIIYADFTNDNYRGELAIPTNINQQGYIDNFSHRIMLNLSNETPTPLITDKPIEFTEGLDIEISPNEQTAA